MATKRRQTIFPIKWKLILFDKLLEISGIAYLPSKIHVNLTLFRLFMLFFSSFLVDSPDRSQAFRLIRLFTLTFHSFLFCCVKLIMQISWTSPAVSQPASKLILASHYLSYIIDSNKLPSWTFRSVRIIGCLFIFSSLATSDRFKWFAWFSHHSCTVDVNYRGGRSNSKKKPTNQ